MRCILDLLRAGKQFYCVYAVRFYIFIVLLPYIYCHVYKKFLDLLCYTVGTIYVAMFKYYHVYIIGLIVYVAPTVNSTISMSVDFTRMGFKCYSSRIHLFHLF